MGAGLAWLALAAFYLLVWGGLVHHRLQQGLHWRWLLRDVLVTNWPVLLGMGLVSLLSLEVQSRRETFAYVVLVGGALMSANLGWLAWSQRSLIRQWRGVA